MKKQWHTHAWIISLGLLVLAPACKGRGESAGANKVRAPESRPSLPLAQAQQVRDRAMPVELMTDSTSPYAAGLFVDDEAIYLTTDKVAYRLLPGGGKPQQIPVENGGTAALSRTDIVYWGQSALWKVPKLGGQAQRQGDLKLQPAYLVASGDDVAWSVVPGPDKFEIQTIENHKARTLYFNPGRIEAMTMGPGRVYFVEKHPDSSWRIGSVSIRGGDLKFAPNHTGPTPAKLALAGDVYHYDLESGEIRKIAADLSRQEVIANKTICSPMAVADKIYCPNMEGLWQLDRHPGATAESVFAEPRRIPNVAANSKFVTWLADVGPDRLSLMLLTLH